MGTGALSRLIFMKQWTCPSGPHIKLFLLNVIHIYRGVMKMDFRYKISTPIEEETEYIGNRLLNYNLESIPLSQEKPFIDINRCIKDENGDIIGGILACSALWNILSIETLWVKEEYRNRGIANQLLDVVETEARKMGCHLAYLSTYDFQAKDFYLKNGYEIFGVLEDCPKDHKLYHLSKRL